MTIDGPDAASDGEQMRVEIEELIAAQAVISTSRDHYAALFEDMPVAEIVMDERGMMVEANRAAALLLRLRGDRPIALRRAVVAEDRPQLDAHLDACRARGVSACEVRLTPPTDGAPVWVGVRSRLVAAERGMFVTAIVDRTECRQLQIEKQNLEEAERAAFAASKAKDTFIAALSHELRSPLTPILAAITALADGASRSEDAADLCTIIRRNVLAQTHLIDDLLDVTRIVSGKIRIDRAPSDLHVLVNETLAGVRGELDGKGLAMTVSLEAANSRVDGDPVRLRQVLSNLIRNAVKFTPGGGHIAVRSWNRGQRVVVEVVDSGVGIAADALERIFVPFEQAADPKRHGGLGLGLAICKGIVDLHGGVVSAHSPGIGKGARFMVELSATGGAPSHAADRVAAARPVRTPHVGARLLLVEDQPDVAKTFKMILARQGYDVQVATSAGQALEENLDDIDVIVSDIGLPDLSGYDLIRHLHARRRLPAIALSGYGTEQDMRASLDAGFTAHITKPIEMPTLVAAIESALKGT